MCLDCLCKALLLSSQLCGWSDGKMDRELEDSSASPPILILGGRLRITYGHNIKVKDYNYRPSIIQRCFGGLTCYNHRL
jgi:hypothetical protein